MNAPNSSNTTTIDFKAIAVICLIICVFFTALTVILMVRLVLEDFFFLFPHVQFAIGSFFVALGSGAGAYFAWKRHRKDKKEAKMARSQTETTLKDQA